MNTALIEYLDQTTTFLVNGNHVPDEHIAKAVTDFIYACVPDGFKKDALAMAIADAYAERVNSYGFVNYEVVDYTLQSLLDDVEPEVEFLKSDVAQYVIFLTINEYLNNLGLTIDITNIVNPH